MTTSPEIPSPQPAPSYRIGTVADILKVPADRRRDMLRELETMLLTHEFSASLGADVGVEWPPLAGFDWTDDGDHSTHVSLNGKPLLTLSITKNADTVIPAPEGAQAAVMRQALEALEIIAEQDRSEGFESGTKTVAAITALRAALAAPAPKAEPVALTPSQIHDLCNECHLDWHRGWSIDEEPNRYLQLARAIEAAHGIHAPQTKEHS